MKNLEIDNKKFIYFKPYDNASINDLIATKLTDLGFQKNRIIAQIPSKFAQIEDYIALLIPLGDEFDLIIGKIKNNRTFAGVKPLIDLPTELVEYDILTRIKLL